MQRYSVYHDGVQYADDKGDYYLVEDVDSRVGKLEIENSILKNRLRCLAKRFNVSDIGEMMIHEAREGAGQ